MANAHRGEVALQAGAATYRLCFTIDALCQLEDRLDLSIVEISERMKEGAVRLSMMRALLWAGLQTHHAPIDEKTAGELIGEIGALELMNGVMVAMNRAFGDDDTAPEAAAEGEAPPADPPSPGRRRARPPRAPAGTGPASSTSG